MKARTRMNPERSSVRPRARSPERAPGAAVLRHKSGRDTRRMKLERLVEYARTHERALVLTHDNPDPDSLASAIALAHILERLAGLEAVVAYGGIVGRAENRALVRVLKLPVVPIAKIDFDDFDLICMVDTQPEQGNHSLPADHFPDVVIDHHPERPETKLAPIADVGRLRGATSTLLAEYFRASGLEMTPKLATALYYGIKADTRNLARQTTPEDVDAYLWLFPLVDKEALVEIEHPRLPIDYFRLYHRAAERAQVWDQAVLCDLGEIYAPDMVAEVAERFGFLEDVRWSLAWGEYEDQLFFSIRTSDRRMNAGKLVREIIEARGGSAGGHGSMAGARIDLSGMGEAARRRLKAEIGEAFLREFGVKPGKKPRKIV
jgi:nanoRNase/pAp phosphatase (c-di-AMP/oligoRNAs hydrolase)